LTVERGLSTPNMLVASIDRAMAAAADNVYVLADHTKVGVETMVQTVALSRIRAVVTDSRTPERQIDRLREAGVEVLVAAP
jgi:DeoR/GlpR family transcriptional regulator of sugar metabolism